jgi:hypothetical protein
MKIYPSLILVIFASVVVSQNSLFTIQSVPAYSLQRVCVQNCVFPGNGDLALNIGCPYPVLNACVCRTDLQRSASIYLTQCVDQGCFSDPSDLSSAISLYDSYYVSNGLPLLLVQAFTTAATSFVTSPLTGLTATAISSSTSLTTTLDSNKLLLAIILILTILAALVDFFH